MTSSSLLIVMLCAGVVGIAAVVTLVVILLKPNKNQAEGIQNESTRNSRQPKRDWESWIPYVAISLLIAFFTVWGALFFLSMVWILRMNPKPYQREIPYPSKAESKSAIGTYTWLFLSPFLTVPTMIVATLNLDGHSSINQRVFAALIPLIFHLPILFKLDTKNAFVYRHTQQALLLVALRAGMASLAFSIGRHGEEAWLFLLGNGALWLFGTTWARNQAIRGKCWIMKRKGETFLVQEDKTQTVEVDQDTKHTPEKYIEYGRWYLKNSQNETAKEYTLKAFQQGKPDIKRQAVAILSQLGEVEKF